MSLLSSTYYNKNIRPFLDADFKIDLNIDSTGGLSVSGIAIKNIAELQEIISGWLCSENKYILDSKQLSRLRKVIKVIKRTQSTFPKKVDFVGRDHLGQKEAPQELEDKSRLNLMTIDRYLKEIESINQKIIDIDKRSYLEHHSFDNLVQLHVLKIKLSEIQKSVVDYPILCSTLGELGQRMVTILSNVIDVYKGEVEKLKQRLCKMILEPGLELTEQLKKSLQLWEDVRKEYGLQGVESSASKLTTKAMELAKDLSDTIVLSQVPLVCIKELKNYKAAAKAFKNTSFSKDEVQSSILEIQHLMGCTLEFASEDIKQTFSPLYKQVDLKLESYLQRNRQLIEVNKSQHQLYLKELESHLDSQDFTAERQLHSTKLQLELEEQISPFSQLTEKSIVQGTYISSLGSYVLKGGTLFLQKRNLDCGKEMMFYSLKLTHHYRALFETKIRRLAWDIESVNKMRQRFNEPEIKFNPHSSITFLSKNELNKFTTRPAQLTLFKACEFEIAELGSLKVGDYCGATTLKNDLFFEIEAMGSLANDLYRLQKFLAVFGLEDILLKQSQDDDEKMKLMQIFRMFFPKHAFLIEQGGAQRQGYALKDFTAHDLRSFIESQKPEMGPIFRKYLDLQPELMEKVESLPGKFIWAINDYANLLRDAGAIALVSEVIGSENIPKTVCSILKKGILSSEARYKLGLCNPGSSMIEDFKSGGAESVFTRLIHQDMPPDRIQPQACSIMYDLSILNRGGYAYNTDLFGTKRGKYYANRLSLLNFTRLGENLSHLNEVMIKDGIPPQFISGLFVESKQQKAQVIAQMEKEGLLEISSAGEMYVVIGEFEHPLESFILGGDDDTKEEV
ncbi:MAG: hypothetical protein K0S74_772 [Chlamydiales bacterium]|jgi:hypothetical protein|nr:hypothetical protein [Chlamydiales bacterium]